MTGEAKRTDLKEKTMEDTQVQLDKDQLAQLDQEQTDREKAELLQAWNLLTFVVGEARGENLPYRSFAEINNALATIGRAAGVLS